MTKSEVNKKVYNPSDPTKVMAAIEPGMNIFIGVIINGMTLLNVPIYTQYILRGSLIFAAVLINRIQKAKI